MQRRERIRTRAGGHLCGVNSRAHNASSKSACRGSSPNCGSKVTDITRSEIRVWSLDIKRHFDVVAAKGGLGATRHVLDAVDGHEIHRGLDVPCHEAGQLHEDEHSSCRQSQDGLHALARCEFAAIARL